MNRWTIMLAGTAALALSSSSASAKVYQYEARLATPVATAGPVRAAVFNWQCSGDLCTITGPWSEPGVGHCKALAKQVGKITAYGYAGVKLDATQLEECNSVVPEAEAP